MKQILLLSLLISLVCAYKLSEEDRMDAAMRKRKRNERFSRPGWFEKVGEKYEAEQEWIALFSEKVVQDTIAQTVELKENAKLR